MRISDWSSDVCSSDLCRAQALETLAVDGLERVAHRRDHARDAGGDERVGAGPGAAGVRARFEGDVGGGALRAVTSLRSEWRRVGKECVSTCRSRWSPAHYQKQ